MTTNVRSIDSGFIEQFGATENAADARAEENHRTGFLVLVLVFLRPASVASFALQCSITEKQAADAHDDHTKSSAGSSHCFDDDIS